MNEDLSGFNNNQQDAYTAGDLNLKWLAYYNQKNRVFLSYAGYQSAYWNAYFNMNRFNYGSHQAKVEYQYRLRNNIQLRLPASYTFTTLAANKYFQNGAGGIGLDISWKKQFFTSLYGQFRKDEFFTVTSSAAQNRDAYRQTYSLDQFYFFKTFF